jgi:hypothetical protein
MNLSWYFNRLRSMEPAEVAHRLAETSRKLISKRQHQGWERFPAAASHPVLPGLSEQVRAASSVQRQSIAQVSAALLSGRYAALGRDWPQRTSADLFPPELWRLDPVTNTLWPAADTYCFDIDFRHDGQRGDIKYVWEINRLQFLPVLAAEWVLSGDVAPLGAIEEAVASWFRANPPFGGVGWASGIEVALRAISILLTLDLVGQSLSAAARQQAGQILAASAFWLARYPSRFSSANNHLVAELTGEFLIGVATERNSDGAWDHLRQELDKQILPDGGGAEQTPTYAAFTAELVLLAVMVARAAGKPRPLGSIERLAAFHDFLAWVGPDARFGDDDEGRVLTLGPEVNYPASVGSAIAAVLQRPSGTGRAEDFRALVIGQPPADQAAPEGLKSFAEAGLSVWRGQLGGRAAVLRFDHGPLGYLSIAAHGHADALALTLDLDGQPILVDPGTYLYGSGGAWRNWFRSTLAHNTLNIAGQSQSMMSGAFNWSHKARSTLVAQASGPDWQLTGEHDGYERRFKARHRRHLWRADASIHILDSLIGVAQEAEIVFQLAPGLEARGDGATVHLSHSGRPVLAIRLPSDSFDINSGGDNPGEGGWVSPGFGYKLAAPRIAWRGVVDAAGVETVLAAPQH